MRSSSPLSRTLAFPAALLALAACSDGASSSNTDPCDALTCVANAHCAADGQAAACLCDAGYAPTADGACAPATVDPCTPNPCVIPHQTACAPDGAGAFTCGCDTGYLPDGAGGCVADPTNPCTPNPCAFIPFQTQCADGGGFPVCTCDPGYADDGFGGCDPTSTDPCDPNPCDAPHRTTCSDVDGFPECSCDADTHDDGDGACVPDDPCDPNPCVAPHRTTCQVASGGATCVCDPDFVDDGAGACVPAVTDPCDPNPCDAPHRGACTATDSGASCACDPGFSDDGSGHCVPDTDPCADSPCTTAHKTVCTPSEGGATCSCDPSFADDGQGGCTAVQGDPCDPNPCTGAHKTTCSPSGAEATCACDDGYHPDGAGGCTNDPCLPSPCTAPHQTQCAAAGDGVACTCDPDYVSDGAGGCEPAADNPCDPNPCDAPLQGACSDQDGVAACACDPGAHDDGEGGCTHDPCLPNPCDAPHAAVCTPDPAASAGYVCGCDPDYYPGVVGCVDACVASPCEEPHRTSCLAAAGISVCSCDPGYHDDGQGTCSDDPCLPDPCSAGEVCQGTPGTAGHACVPCLDHDEDGYGVGVGCLGPDCDDTSDAIFAGCACPPAHGDGDAFEEDECFFIATPIASGETQSHSIAPAGDVDWLVFSAAAGDMVRLVKASGGPAMRMTLVDRDGVAEVESKVATSSSSLLIDRKLPAGGDWFVRLQGTYATTSGDYAVTFDNLGPDDHGDTADDATALANDGVDVAGAFEIGGNVDWFSFDVAPGHAYQIWAKPNDGTGVAMRLYDQDATTLLETRESSYSTAVMIDRGDMAAGTYFVRLSANYGSTNVGTYAVRVVDLGLDDHGDSAADATLVASDGVDVAGVFEVGGNVDWFAFDVTAGHMYQAWCKSIDSTGCTLRLYDQDGQTLLETSEASYNTSAFIDRGTLAAGRYYLRASPNYGSASIGGYHLRVVDLGLDDHGDTPATATPLGASGVKTAGRFQVGGNADWFSFSVTAGHMVQLWCKPLDSTGALLRLYGQDGQTLLETSEASYNTSTFIDRGTLSAGTYYLRASPNYGSASVGDYEIWLVDLGLDDHGNSPEDATPLAANDTPLAGLFEVGGNVDWFAFDVAPGHMVQLRCTPSASTGCALRLYDRDGATLLETSTSSYTSTAFIDRGGLTAGTYYLRVSPNYGSTSTGGYAVRVTDLGLDDHGSDAATATPLTVGAAATAGVFQVGGDSDWFSFSATAGTTYTLRCAPVASVGCSAAVLGSGGTSLLKSWSSSYTNAATSTWTATVTGTLYLRVQPNYGSDSFGAYTVSVAGP